MIHDDQVADHAAGIATPEYFTPFTPHGSCAQDITAPRPAKRTYRHVRGGDLNGQSVRRVDPSGRAAVNAIDPDYVHGSGMHTAAVGIGCDPTQRIGRR